MNSRQRYRAKRMSKFNAEMHEKKTYARRLDNAFVKLSEGCSKRVVAAINSTEYKMNMRDRGEPAFRDDSGPRCLPNVWKYQAGNRAVRKDATHIIRCAVKPRPLGRGGCQCLK